MEKTVLFNLNGEPVRLTLDEGRVLLWILRIELGLRGMKYGCGEGLRISTPMKFPVSPGSPRSKPSWSIILHWRLKAVASRQSAIWVLCFHAVFDAVGTIMFELPMTPDPVKKAIQQA